METFRDRREAGRLLAERLRQLELEGEVCVFALPRGGVPLAREIANAFRAPLDLLFVKKIGAPHQPELALGAVSEGGQLHWKQEVLDYLGIPPAKLRDLAEQQEKALNTQLEKWRQGRGPERARERTAIVVDDGLATGATMAAALGFLRSRKPKRIVVAVPVASRTAIETIRGLCDDVVVLEMPPNFESVGQFYEDFSQVSDDDVRELTMSGDAHPNAGDDDEKNDNRPNNKPVPGT